MRRRCGTRRVRITVVIRTPISRRREHDRRRLNRLFVLTRQFDDLEGTGSVDGSRQIRDAQQVVFRSRP